MALVLVSAAARGHGHPTVRRRRADRARGEPRATCFDRAPGRTTKFALLCYVPIAFVCGTGATGVATAVVVGAGLALLPDDLREHLMLGDTGANVLGAVLGLAVVLEAAPATRVVVAIVLLAANLASEFVSFSRVIERVAPLRALRRTGPGGDLVKRVTAVLAVVLVVGRRVRGRTPASAATSTRTPIRRVLVFSMPGVTWSELDTVELPNIEGFLADSAVASLAPRAGGRPPTGSGRRVRDVRRGHPRRRAARRRRGPVRRRRDRRRRARG